MAASPPYRTFDDVVDGLAAIEQRFLRVGDRRSIFASLYGVISVAARERVNQGFFTDNDWIGRYAVTFANLYRTALDRYEEGRRSDVPKAWLLAFDFAQTGDGLVLQDLLLGVNAHVNNDLAFALHSVSIDPDRGQRHQDHTTVNQVFAAVLERATERIAALYAPGLLNLDNCAGQIDELVGLFSMEVARESAWEGAVSLANARSNTERSLTAKLISSRAAVMARLLRAPSLKPAFIDACRRIEAGANWKAVLAATV